MKHSWGEPLRTKPKYAVARQRCRYCGLTRIEYRRVGGAKGFTPYEYKRGHTLVDQIGPLMNQTPPCERKTP